MKLGILEESSSRNKLDARLSTANRFILEQICNDFRRVRQYDFSLDQVSKLHNPKLTGLSLTDPRHSKRMDSKDISA